MNSLSWEGTARISLRIPRVAAAIEEAEQRGVQFSHLVARVLRRELDRPADPRPGKREDPPT
jgi:hypothetical protein